MHIPVERTNIDLSLTPIHWGARKNVVALLYFENMHDSIFLRQAASLWLFWGRLPQNNHNEAAYLKTKAACLKI